MKHFMLLVIFLIINFGSLAIGGWLMNNGPQTQWYLELNKAPWTPPGWVFGAAWTTIMVCYSIYMAQLFAAEKSGKVIALFVFQVLLNVSWNYIFFNQHRIGLALLIIIVLTLLILYFLFGFYDRLQFTSLLLIPYVAWLVVATSLNYYIYTNN